LSKKPKAGQAQDAFNSLELMLFYEPMQERQLVAFLQLVHLDSHTIIFIIRYLCLKNISLILSF
jgi:hypothetical protein